MAWAVTRFRIAHSVEEQGVEVLAVRSSITPEGMSWCASSMLKERDLSIPRTRRFSLPLA